VFSQVYDQAASNKFEAINKFFAVQILWKAEGDKTLFRGSSRKSNL
jgi:hypothetical protein